MNRQVDPKWYEKVFTADILDMPWAEGIVGETQVVLDMLEAPAKGTVLDLACGFGHHALELARRGYEVTGVDLSHELVEHAVSEAERRNLRVELLCADLRGLRLGRTFDVVLSLFDGAIGYFETEEENLETFAVISAHLKSGGRHLMQVPNPDYARKHYPQRTWSAGSKMLEVLEYDWDEVERVMYASTQPISYGEVFPGMAPIETRQRVYELDELEAILASNGMRISKVYSLLDAAVPASDDCDYMSVISRKN